MPIARLVKKLLKRNSTETVYLFSFPKCGRTWLRLMLGTVFADHYKLQPDDPMDLEWFAGQIANFPKLVVTHDGFPHAQLPEELPQSKSEYRDNKVIFLVRDPRDVVCSLYFQRKYREHLSPTSSVDTSISSDMPMADFLKVRQGGLATIIEYYNIWERNKEAVKDYMVVKYESLHEHAALELHRILDFLDIRGISDKLIDEKVKYCSFENMRSFETNNSLNSFRLQPGDASQPETFKTRKGKVGGYREQLSDEEIQFMEDMIATKLDPAFGY